MKYLQEKIFIVLFSLFPRQHLKMSYRGGRGGRGGLYHHGNNINHSNNNFQQQGFNADQYMLENSVPIDISGWDGASMEDCVGFIQRKCKVTVRNALVDMATLYIRGYVKNQQDVNTLLSWSGVKFAGKSLKFMKVNATNNSNNGSSTGNVIEALTHFLKTRYQPEMKLLNLSTVKHDPTLTQLGFFASLASTSKFFTALMKVAGDMNLEVKSIDLSGNELSDLTSISIMAYTFPKLQNLSLQNNNLNRIKSFETFKRKLNFLRELILVGNPVVNISNPAEIQNVKLELMKTFPRLVVLNGETLRHEQALISNLSFPFESQQAIFFQDQEIQLIATNFITSYINLWDSNRQGLMVLYQAESQFSMQTDSAHPHTLEVSNDLRNTPAGPDFGYYLPLSRNLTKVSSVKSRLNRVGRGPEQIYKMFTQLPKTRHELVNKPELYSMECQRFPQLNAIMVTLHGSFEEVAAPDNLEAFNSSFAGPKGRMSHNNRNKKVTLTPKSFDRTLVVIPGHNGSMIVATDLLLVRPFSKFLSWNDPKNKPSSPAVSVLNPNVGTPPPHSSTPQPQPPVSVGTPLAADLPLEIKNNLTPVQQEVLVKILLETKLNLQYGVMLCEQSQWDYNQCIINFRNSVASLPQEAYIR